MVLSSSFLRQVGICTLKIGQKSLLLLIMNYRIYPPDELLQTTVDLPLSKSVSNRALIIGALSQESIIPQPLAECSDTIVMLRALQSTDELINVADAGTAMRFLTAYFACQDGRTVTIDGTERMRQRPIGPLVDALRNCGAEIEYLGKEGFPPLLIHGKELQGGDISIDATISSQFISALLMIAPKMTNGLRLTLIGEVASLPYIDLTLSMMQSAGAIAERTVDVVEVSPGLYTSADRLKAEKDWSAAAFWYEIEALTCGFTTLTGLDINSRQPDHRAIEIFSQLGVNTEEGEDSPEDIDLTGSPDVSPRLIADMSSTPDLVPAVAVTCAMNGVPFQLSGLESLKIKECDRFDALATELLKVGVVIENTDNHTMSWDGERRPIMELPVFDTYGDHRMAMALAPVSTYIPGIVIRDIEVVKKSYPTFWTDLQQAGFTLIDADNEINPNTPDTEQ